MSYEVIKKRWEFALPHVTQCQFKTSVGSCVYVVCSKSIRTDHSTWSR